MVEIINWTPSQYFAYISDDVAIMILAFVGGYVDSAGYLKLQGLFTSSITGNLVAASSSMVHLDGVLCRALTCIAFTGGAALAQTCALRMKIVYNNSPRIVSIFCFTLELIMFVATIVLGQIYLDDIDNAITQDNWAVVLLGCIMGISMGFHSVAAKVTIATNPPVVATTVMTSTLVTVAQNASDVINYGMAMYSCPNLRNRDDTSDIEVYKKSMTTKFYESLGKFITTSKPLIIFVIGAVLGAVITEESDFVSIIVPSVFVLFLIYCVYMKDTAGTSTTSATTSSPVQTVENTKAQSVEVSMVKIQESAQKV